MTSAALGFESLRALGELAIVRAREKAEKTLGANGADGISEVLGSCERNDNAIPVEDSRWRARN